MNQNSRLAGAPLLICETRCAEQGVPFTSCCIRLASTSRSPRVCRLAQMHPHPPKVLSFRIIAAHQPVEGLRMKRKWVKSSPGSRSRFHNKAGMQRMPSRIAAYRVRLVLTESFFWWHPSRKLLRLSYRLPPTGRSTRQK